MNKIEYKLNGFVVEESQLPHLVTHLLDAVNQIIDELPSTKTTKAKQLRFEIAELQKQLEELEPKCI